MLDRGLEFDHSPGLIQKKLCDHFSDKPRSYKLCGINGERNENWLSWHPLTLAYTLKVTDSNLKVVV